LRRNRRVVLTDRLIPFLAALVGLVALGGAVLVEVNGAQRAARLSDELAALRDSIAALGPNQAAPARDEELVEAVNRSTDAMLALQQRMDRLEADWAAAPQAAARGPALPGNPANGSYAPRVGEAVADVDPSWPTTDCIPLGTRFMASVGDSLAICQSPVKITVRAVTDDNVMLDEVGLVTETAFKSIPGSNCQLTVFTADGEGFAEMRVSCL
jgi:hypothetical protein